MEEEAILFGACVTYICQARTRERAVDALAVEDKEQARGIEGEGDQAKMLMQGQPKTVIDKSKGDS